MVFCVVLPSSVVSVLVIVISVERVLFVASMFVFRKKFLMFCCFFSFISVVSFSLPIQLFFSPGTQ